MTDQLPNQVRKAFDALDVHYDADDLDDGVGRLHARARSRRTKRVATGALVAIAVIVTAFAMTRRESKAELALADGTRWMPLDAKSAATLVRDDASGVLLRVDKGRVRFEVAKQHGRRFEVEAGRVTVHVVGTVFEVERQGDDAKVTVHEGRVEVTRGGEVAVAVDANGSWPAAAIDTPAAPAEVVPSVPAGKHTAIGTSGSRATETASAPMGNGGRGAWRSLARSGEYHRAYVALRAKDSDAPRDSAEDLFLAADSARLSGHPAEAVQYLTAIMDRHAGDGRADLAAFTLGRIYLESLNEPAKAARTFAAARELGPHGELAEDALAREVESWKRAGNADKARDRARVYVETYPRGQRVEAMRGLVSSP